MDRRSRIAEALSHEFPQSRRLSRGLHGPDRQGHRRGAKAPLAQDRRLLVSARRHSDRRLLADGRSARASGSPTRASRPIAGGADRNRALSRNVECAAPLRRQFTRRPPHESPFDPDLVASFAAAPVLVRSALAQTRLLPFPRAESPSSRPRARPNQGDAGRRDEPHAEPHRPAQGLSPPPLKQFTGFEIAEQETIAGILRAIRNGEAPSGAIPRRATPRRCRRSTTRARSREAAPDGRRPGFDRESPSPPRSTATTSCSIQEAYLRGRRPRRDERRQARPGHDQGALTLLGDIAHVSEHAERCAAITAL